MIESIQNTQISSSLISSVPSKSSKKGKEEAGKILADLASVAATLESQAGKKAAKSTKAAPPPPANKYGTQDGLYGALAAMVEMILAIQQLQGSNTKLLEKLSKIVAATSNAENLALEAQAAVIAKYTGKDDSGKLAAANAKFHVLMTTYSNKIQTEQTQVQNYMSLTSDQSKSISSDAQNSQSIIGTMLDVAGLLR